MTVGHFTDFLQGQSQLSGLRLWSIRSDDHFEIRIEQLRFPRACRVYPNGDALIGQGVNPSLSLLNRAEFLLKVGQYWIRFFRNRV